MDAEDADLATGHAQEPKQQEHLVQSDTAEAGHGVSMSLSPVTEANGTADEVSIAAVHAHQAVLQDAAGPIKQTLSSSPEQAIH